MSIYHVNLYLVSINVRPGYLNTTKIKFSKEFNLNVIQDSRYPVEYIYNDDTLEKYPDLLEKYKNGKHSEKDLSILLGYPCEIPSLLINRWGYSCIFYDYDKKEHLQIFAFLSPEKIDKEEYSISYIEGMNRYNLEYSTNYKFKLTENLRGSVKYYCEKLQNRIINKDDIFTIANKFHCSRAKNFAKLIINLQQDIFKKSKVIDFLVIQLKSIEVDIGDKIISLKEIDDELSSILLDLLN